MPDGKKTARMCWFLSDSAIKPLPTIFFGSSTVKKGAVNAPEYHQGLIDKIYLYGNKITVLCNTKDSHFDVNLSEKIRLKDIWRKT